MQKIWGFERGTAVRIAIGAGLLTAVVLWSALGTIALLLGLIVSVLPVPLYVSLALWLDRYDYEPIRLLFKAFVWGAVIAASTAMLVNDGFTYATGSEFLASVLVAPIGEEILKAAALLLLFRFHRHEFDNVTDGVVYATMVGLGFAMTENIYYYGAAMLDGMADFTFFVRGVLSPYAHPLFTAFTGIGIGIAHESRTRAVRLFAPAGGLLAAIGLHSLWNYSADVGVFFAVYVFIMVPVFAAVLIVVNRSLQREEAILREYLRPELVAGVLTLEQLETICAVPGRIRISWRHLLRRDLKVERCAREEAAVELAFLRWREARGAIAASEDAEIRLRERGYAERLAVLAS